MLNPGLPLARVNSALCTIFPAALSTLEGTAQRGQVLPGLTPGRKQKLSKGCAVLGRWEQGSTSLGFLSLSCGPMKKQIPL